MKINIAKPSVDGLIRIPTNKEIQKQEAIRQNRIGDLPVIPQKMNVIALVLTYTSFGLSDIDVAASIGITEEQVIRIRALDEYNIIKNDLIEKLKSDDVDKVRDMIHKNSVLAASKIGMLISHTDPTVALAASKDVLDRSGQRPIDIVEHRHKIDGGLTIEIIKRDNKDLPTIDIDCKEL